MGKSSVYFNRSAFSNSSANSEFNSDQTCNHHRQLISVSQIVIRKLIHTFRPQAWQRSGLGAILAGLVMIIMPTHALAAQMTLAWDANNSAPDGYLVFQRINDGISNLEEYLADSDPTQDDGNHPPGQPTLTNPVQGESGVALNPWLYASDFSDPDSNDQHSQTQWRIALSSGTEQIVLDRTCITTHLTEMRTPRLVLDPSTEYTVQVRFYDDNGKPSPWSLPVTFTTQATARDKNKNKIPDSQEVSADADMNGDNIPDLEQTSVVKSAATYNDQHIMAVSVETNDTTVEVQAALNVDPMTLVSTDYSTPYPEAETPYGLIGYKIKVDQPGDSVRATIHLSYTIDPQQTQWVRYDEILGMQDCSTETTMDESGLMVERNLVDGGDEDADGTANGVIVDLSGPRVSNATDNSNLAISADGQAASGGNSGSCFIQSLF